MPLFDFRRGTSVVIEPSDSMSSALQAIANASQPDIFLNQHLVLNTAMIDQTFFVNQLTSTMTVLGISLRAGTLENTANDSTVMVERVQGTEAPGSGDDLLAAAVNLKTGLTAHTTLAGTLTGTGANLTLATGDGLALDFGGTAPTEARNLLVMVRLRIDLA